MVAAAVIGSAVVGAGAGLYGASKSADAAKNAAQIQSDAATQAGDRELAMFQQNRADSMPWLEAGRGALGKLSDYTGTSSNTSAPGYGSLLKPFGMEDYQADPGYQFRLSEGQKALDRTAGSKGSYFSGAQLKAAQGYGQGLASEEYGKAYDRFTQNQNNIYNRLAGISGTGQTSAATLGNQGANFAGSLSNLTTGAANANAAGTVGAANAWSTGLQGVGTAANSGVQNYLLMDYLKGRA